mmetsp:Transcript_8210/g.16920  ORF Transcript_8210/g.16920 Transcript_8210/m.16920 type:complete len:165 (-) Transcript_8210:167-661(-)
MGWSFGIFTIFSKLTKGINSLCEDDPESEEVKAIVRDHIENNLIAIFSNAYCSFCQKARRLAIDELDVVPAMLDIEVKDDPINGMGRVSPVHQQLANLLGSKKPPRLPQIWVNKNYIGGFEEFRRLIESRQLTKQSIADSFTFSFGSATPNTQPSTVTPAATVC